MVGRKSPGDRWSEEYFYLALVLSYFCAFLSGITLSILCIHPLSNFQGINNAAISRLPSVNKPHTFWW